jgi:anti-sigma B factor antagonist
MTSPNAPGRDGDLHSRQDLDDQALENRLRIWAEYPASCVVIGVAGEIDIATADRLRMQVIIAVLAATPPSVVIDLGEVKFCDSPGLSALVAIWKATRAYGGKLVLARPQDWLRALLAHTRLDTRITVRDHLPDAITAAG